MLFERMEQFLCRYAVKLGQREQIGSAGIGNALLPFGYSLCADPEEFSEFALRKPVLPAVIQDIFADSDSVLHFTRLYVS